MFVILGSLLEKPREAEEKVVQRTVSYVSFFKNYDIKNY